MRVIAGEARGRQAGSAARHGYYPPHPRSGEGGDVQHRPVRPARSPCAGPVRRAAASWALRRCSRGAARCVFLDENREAVSIVMKNCKTCGVFDRSRVNIGEAARFLSACREQFDLVLLDPPFHSGTLENILPIVDKCVAPGGIVHLRERNEARPPRGGGRS